MKRYNLDGTFFYCPVDLTLSVVGGRWKGLVFWNLRDGTKRYGELKKILVGINDKMLSQVLKELDLTYRSIYQCRHSFASNMLSNGENSLWVSQMLGHKSLSTTLTKYSKYLSINSTRKLTYLD